MTLHLEGGELRLAERAIEALETIAEKLTVEPEAPKCRVCGVPFKGVRPGDTACASCFTGKTPADRVLCMEYGDAPAPERFSLTENRRFVDGYCEAATIDGGKVTRRCLRGKDHDGECDMRDVCRGTPGMASWNRCEKAKGHVNPCTHDPSTNDGHVSPANDDDGLPDRAEALREIAKDNAPRNIIEAVHDLDAAVQADRRPFHEVLFPRVAYDQSKPPVGTFTRSQLGDEPKCTCGAPLVVRHAESCAVVQSKKTVPGADASHLYVTVCALTDLYRAAETCCPRTLYPTEVVKYGVTALLDVLHPSDAYKVVDGIRRERETAFAKLTVVTNRRRRCLTCDRVETYGADGRLYIEHGRSVCTSDPGHTFSEWADTKSAGRASPEDEAKAETEPMHGGARVPR